MTQNALLELPDTALMERLISMALATCPSAHTRRAYATQLRSFVASGLPLNRDGVSMHLAAERERVPGGSTLTTFVSAIRKLVAEAQIRGLMTADEVAQIASIKPGKQYRTRRGMWLTVAQVQNLLKLPDRKTYWGKRDAALLSIMAGCGLRRAEMADIAWDNYQLREGRPCLVDIVGKGNKRRTIPVPTWASNDVDRWLEATKLPQPVEPHNTGRARDLRYIAAGMKADTIHEKVQLYGRKLGLELNPHDLRRTLAQMMRKAGAPLEQIQMTLGHESIATTITYLGSTLELGAGLAEVDKLGLRQGDDD